VIPFSAALIAEYGSKAQIRFKMRLAIQIAMEYKTYTYRNTEFPLSERIWKDERRDFLDRIVDAMDLGEPQGYKRPKIT
jgi:hypothetical protein